ncbi:MAG TPA: MarR family transcriptional regulator [Erysipelothrix sp.]|nr:MarR family transcriptional regulator [Erysipelothrix sp.]
MKDLKSLIILFKAHTSIENVVKKSLENTDLSVNEFAALEALYHKGSLSTQGLIDLVLIPNSSMTYVLDVLHKKEYIKRIKDEKDRRIQRLTLTEAGHAKFEEVYKVHFEMLREVFDALDDAQEKELQTYLKIIGKKAQGGN